MWRNQSVMNSTNDEKDARQVEGHKKKKLTVKCATYMFTTNFRNLQRPNPITLTC